METKTVRTLLTAALLTAVTLPAQASLTCETPVQTVGKAGANPATALAVSRNNDGAWRIDWTLRDGTVIHRSEQYTITDKSDFAKNPALVGWTGSLPDKPWLVMIGVFVERNDGSTDYVESLFDQKRGDKLVMQASSRCTFDPETAPVDPSAPAAKSSPKQAEAALTSDDGGKSNFLTVGLGANYASQMLFDTGATAMSVTERAANTLIAHGLASEGEPIDVSLADGSHKMTRVITINHVTIAGMTVDDVRSFVVPDGGMQLLGMGVLSRFGKFSIDLPNGKLILG
jgi:clan AA aspartic protease (TIGR02281 family)